MRVGVTMKTESTKPLLKKHKEALEALAEVCEKHDITLGYTRDDDGVHFYVGGEDISRDEFSNTSTELAEGIREFPANIEI